MTLTTKTAGWIVRGGYTPNGGAVETAMMQSPTPRPNAPLIVLGTMPPTSGRDDDRARLALMAARAREGID
ncbi:hypothetical protein ACEPTV_33275 [Burkholderia pseudomallei]|uniref:hypothetical protein n=1 Tax=Burkholderia pseudomallei TaxID=28450 RepID=UPI00358F4012